MVSKKKNRAYGLGSPLQDVFPEPVKAQRAPTTADMGYEIGQIWVDQTSGQIYGMASVVSGSATWSILGPGASDVDTITGDTGGAISPTAGNVNILGGDLLSVDGAGSTLTLNSTASGYPITPYVVGLAGQAGYTTIQAAIDAATAAGGANVIWVQPGTYTEDLNITSSITFMSIDGVATIIGIHTPPASGAVTFDGIVLISATHIISSAAAGSTVFNINNSFIIVTNGYVFNVPNWTGEILMDNCGEASTNDGVVNNVTGSSDIKFINVEMGAGTGQTMQLNGGGGFLRFDTCNVNCPVNLAGSGQLIMQNGVRFGETVTIGGSLTGYAIQTAWRTGASQAITFNSSGDFSISSGEIQSTNDPAIGGTGAGTLTLTSIAFPDNANLAATLTIVGGTSTSGTFNTSDQVSGLTISGDDIDADGSATDISITVSPKGTGDFIVDAGDIIDTAGDIVATRDDIGGGVMINVINTDNTDNGSLAGFEASVGGPNAGDPFMRFIISGDREFVIGIDNSSLNDDFVISQGIVIGVDNKLVIDGVTGDTQIIGNLALTSTATQIQMEGGLPTDYIGQATLVAGTVTIANTNITAGDRVFVTRENVGASTALGIIDVSITAGVSFTITALQPATPGATETNDVSTVNFVIFLET